MTSGRPTLARVAILGLLAGGALVPLTASAADATSTAFCGLRASGPTKVAGSDPRTYRYVVRNPCTRASYLKVYLPATGSYALPEGSATGYVCRMVAAGGTGGFLSTTKEKGWRVLVC